MATQEHYSLRWNNHQNHILRAFDTLLQTKTLVDVTLVCAETSIRAHKVVLSACSPFFQRVFSETPCKHPVIVLKDFRGWVVQAIVDFMYRGEISVPQERLQTLIQAGENLQVRGLVDHPVAGNTPTPAASPDEFSMMDDSMEPHNFGDTTALLNSTSKLLLPHVFADATTNNSNNNNNNNNSNNHNNNNNCSNNIINNNNNNNNNSNNTNNNLSTPEICTSPMPRRKQARPRRRSGECAPQDLSSKPSTPVPPPILSLNTNALTTTTTTTTTAAEVISTPNQSIKSSSSSSSNLNCSSSSSARTTEIKPKKEKLDKEEKNPKEDDRPPSSLPDDDDDEDEEEDDMDEDRENEESQISMEGPENLCTKNSANSLSNNNNNNNVDNLSNNNNNNNNSSSNNNNNNNNNSNNNNNRIVLSLKDIRHLNRSSSLNRPPHLPPPNLPTNMQLSPPLHHMNLNNHPPPLGHPVNNMKLESAEEAAREMLERESPFMTEMDLQLAHQHLLHGGHAIEHLAGLTNKEFKDLREFKELRDFKDFKDFSSSPMSLPPHFGQPDGHHPNSPLNFPHIPSVSALALTPPHMFGLDSPLGLFPPGMDPGKLYSPLMEMSDPRGMHPDPPPFLKKKLNRPKGQHSAPRGGPPRSWTNAELTEALQHVWNKKMTTSQASRIFGIPYNSLLMYVRGKYGKSLKLEQLRKDCISGPPIELLTMGMSGSKKSHNQNNEMKDDIPSNLPRSSSSEPDLMSSPTMFNPFPPGFYPDFAGGFPGLPLSVLNLLPPERHNPHHSMQIDEDCKSDRSKQSIDDDFPQPLALNRDERREILQQNGQD